MGFDSRSLAQQNWHNIAPRLGVAYRPWGNNTVFRAGWGVFYNVVPFVYALNFADVPFSLAEPQYSNPKSNPQVIFPRVFPATGTGGPSDVALSSAQNPNLKTTYSMQYNFTIERQQWNTGFRASYIGTAMRRGVYQYNYNAPVANTQLFINKPRPFPNLPDIYYVTNGAGHQYNGLTLEATRHLASGLYFQSAWTWARDRYDMDYNWDFGTDKFTLEDPRNRQREIGPAQEIPTHRWATNFIYQLPFGKGKHFGSNVSRLGNLLIGGWETLGHLHGAVRPVPDALLVGRRPGGCVLHRQCLAGHGIHPAGHPEEPQLRTAVARPVVRHERLRPAQAWTVRHFGQGRNHWSRRQRLERRLRQGVRVPENMPGCAGK